ncbi:MAG: M56 family metallopeptidase [Bacteroidota bacterium]
MNELIIKIIGFNLVISVFYLAYLISYRNDKAFGNRRLFLLVSLGLSLLLPFIPSFLTLRESSPFLISYDLEGIQIIADAVQTGPFVYSVTDILLAFYVLVSLTLSMRLSLQLLRVFRAALRSERISIDGRTVLVSQELHGSSFFGWIFLDPARCNGEELSHILRHESVHVRQYHSADRMIIEILLLFNWFNPLLWLLRKSLIEDHEYLADSAVVGEGTDVFHYQLSILNQYIGCASLNNQFSSQIKKRIKMLNQSHCKKGRWKIAFLLPVSIFALFLLSCVEKSDQDSALKSASDEVLYTQAEEMPAFNGEDDLAFRKFIAEKLIYPTKALENGVQGKVFVQFIVDAEGQVRIATPEEIAKAQNVSIDEVVVAAYKALNNENQDEELIQLLKDEAERVVLLSSGKWTPAKNGGKPVSVLFTFPITFVLQ